MSEADRPSADPRDQPPPPVPDLGSGRVRLHARNGIDEQAGHG